MEFFTLGFLMPFTIAVPQQDVRPFSGNQYPWRQTIRNVEYANKTPVYPRPPIVIRSEWRARKPLSREPLKLSPTPYVVVHHGGIPEYCENQKTCSTIVRSYQNLHLDERHWVDIGYHFLIGGDGNVYEGRGWDAVGAHAPGYNTQSIGICMIGNFNEFLPNKAALKTLRQLINYGVTLGKLKRDYRVIGHRQTRVTECPGQALYEYIQTLSHWTDRPVPIFSSKNNSSLPNIS